MRIQPRSRPSCSAKTGWTRTNDSCRSAAGLLRSRSSTYGSETTGRSSRRASSSAAYGSGAWVTSTPTSGALPSSERWKMP
jgi:hypothetical protein